MAGWQSTPPYHDFRSWDVVWKSASLPITNVGSGSIFDPTYEGRMSACV
jgi:hypothetical protein